MLLPAVSSIAPLPSGVLGITASILQVAVLGSSYQAERTAPSEYSKFASLKEDTLKNPIPGQLGMWIIYTPAMLTAALYTFSSSSMLSTSLVAPLLLIHYFKRVAEVTWLHKYSGQMPLQQAVVIGIVYTLYTIEIASNAVPLGSNDPAWRALGLNLFFIGILGNLYHHYLLANLRKDNNTPKGARRYSPPVGGLFPQMAAPHYFFELVAWFGIACVAQQINAFLVFGTMIAYLVSLWSKCSASLVMFMSVCSLLVQAPSYRTHLDFLKLHASNYRWPAPKIPMTFTKASLVQRSGLEQKRRLFQAFFKMWLAMLPIRIQIEPE
jgi:hypothetical protein